MRWIVIAGAAVAVIAVGAITVTRAQALSDDTLNGLVPDATRGASLYAAAGCASCHLAPEAEDGPLSGGQAFATDFGTFYAPNISTDRTHGIGDWTDLELVQAITKGTSPDGSHYYPAFPYTAYQDADLQDIVDLVAHLRTLPASDTPSRPHDVGFPFNIRATLGGWKMLFAQPGWVIDTEDPQIARGRYLVEALGHCGECHTPRGALGGLDDARWLAGAPTPDGEGRVPNITPGGLNWSAGDIASYLDSGFTPDFDTAGGEMVAVIRNSTSQLIPSDRDAIAAYLKAVPSLE